MSEVSPPEAQVYIAGLQAAGEVYCGKAWVKKPAVEAK